MQSIIFWLIAISSFLAGCLDTGYNQPVYIISDGAQEEEELSSEEEEIR